MLFFKNVKIVGSTFPSTVLLKCRNILYDSSWSTKGRYSQSNNKKINQASEEMFFPTIRIGGLRDKIALVTGGTDGIGVRCVRELLTSGVKGVMIADTSATRGYDTVKEFSKIYGQGKIAFIQINPSSYTLLKNSFVSTINFFKGLDIVVNNVNFKEKNWEDQVDENIKRIVLCTQLCLEFMGRNNGGRGGILLNITSDHGEHTESCPLHKAVEDFLVRFDCSIASAHFNSSNIRVLTVCKATIDSIGHDLATIITKGSNGSVWRSV